MTSIGRQQRRRGTSGMTARLGQMVRGVRGRSAMVSAVAVAVVLAVGGLAMLWLFRSQLQTVVDDALTQSARSRADLLDGGADPQTVVDPGPDESMVLVGTVDGRTVASGGSYLPIEGVVPASLGQPLSVDLLVAEHGSSGIEGERETEEMRVVAEASNQGLVVVVGVEAERLNNTVARLAQLFLFAVPTMAAVMLVLSWFTVGRALRPVDRIRHEAAVIGGQDLSRRVPVPEAQDEIRQLAVTMNHMLGRLQAHDENLRQFTADASHELKSPVANLRVLLETHSINDPTWQDIQPKVSGELDRLRSLIDNLLFLAAHDEQRLSPSAASAASALVAVDDLLFAEAEIIASTTELSVDVANVGPAMVRGSASDLQRMFRNLSDNAARHATSTVAFFCHEDESSGVISVQVVDDGPGIQPQDRARIFERFTRLDRARTRDTGGTGLGLAIVDAVARDHQGTVSVGYADENGSTGSRFTVSFVKGNLPAFL